MVVFLRRLWFWLRRSQHDADLRDEIEAHRALRQERLERDGAAPDVARLASTRALGNVTLAREEARDVWIAPFLDGLWQDTRHAWRMAKRSPGFTCIAVLSTAGGIAAATVVFSLVRAVLLQPLPYPAADRIVCVQEVVPALEKLYPSVPANLQHFRTWKRSTHAFDLLAAVKGDAATITGSGEPERVELIEASADLFTLLGIQPQLGRSLVADDETRRLPVVVISHAMWQRRFGGAADVLGRAILLDGVGHTVVGVLPASFWFPAGTELRSLPQLENGLDVIRPLGALSWYSEGWAGDYDLTVLGRLATGATQAQAREELDALETRIAAEHQGVDPGLHTLIVPLHDAVTGQARIGLYGLLASVLGLLMVVCANLTALLLARTMSRGREFAVRAAIGAGRVRLTRAVLMESLLLVTGSGVLGVACAAVALRALVASGALDLPRSSFVRVDAGVVQFSLLLVVICTLVVAWLPALRLTYDEPQRLLRTSGRSTGGPHVLRLRNWLVTAETALCTVLLIGAGLLIASFGRVLHVDRGFSTERTLSARITVSANRYPSKDDRNAFFDRAIDALQRVPGVTSVALVSGLPLTGETHVNGIELEGTDRQATDSTTGERLMVNVRFVSPDYFRTIGIPLRAGRTLTWSDRAKPVAVISQKLATALWPTRDPLGRRFTTGSGVRQVEVVGIVGDVHNGSLEGPATPIVYVPLSVRGPLWVDLVVRTRVDERSLVQPIRRAVWDVDSSAVVSRIGPLTDLVDRAITGRRFQMRMAAGFAAAALLLTLLGTYGVVAYGVAQRRNEIGVRVALGARQRDVVIAIMTSGLRPVMAGLAAGLVGGLAGTRLIRGLLFGVSPSDPVVVGCVVAMIGGVAVLATLLPARTASRINPLSVLRSD